MDLWGVNYYNVSPMIWKGKKKQTSSLTVSVWLFQERVSIWRTGEVWCLLCERHHASSISVGGFVCTQSNAISQLGTDFLQTAIIKGVIPWKHLVASPEQERNTWVYLICLNVLLSAIMVWCHRYLGQFLFASMSEIVLGQAWESER